MSWLSTGLAILVANLFSSTSHAEPQAPIAQGIDPQVALRVSHELLEELVPKTLAQPFDIDTNVESTTFKGSGLATGTISVQMNSSEQGADFYVEVAGDTTETFNGTRSPVKFYSRGSGPFLTRTEIAFDGQQFSQLDTNSSSKQCVSTYRLCSKRKRLIGKLVRRIGWKKVGEATPKMNNYVSKRVQDGVAEALDDVVAELIQELNDLITGELSETIIELEPKSGNWRWSLSNETSYLQAAIGPISDGPAFNGPIDTQIQSDIELWIKLDREDAGLLAVASVWSDSHELLKSFLPPEEAKHLPPDVGIRSEGDWAVLEIGRKGLGDLAGEFGLKGE